MSQDSDRRLVDSEIGSAPPPRAGVKDIVCTSAEDLLEKLSPRNSSWNREAENWIYRGHADADWELKPVAMRSAHAFERFGIGRSHPKDWSERLEQLLELLARFRAGLDRAGIVIPTPSPRVGRWEFNSTSSGAEPPREAFPLMALAQHHGLPTLFLDWTRRAWVAAYFAAVEAAEHCSSYSPRNLAVWALYRDPTPKYNENTDAPRFYDAPGGTNPNLRAQAGLFTLFGLSEELSIEEFFARRADWPRELRRVVLETRHAPRLLRLLADEEISGATLFPGADGVVRGMRESALWERSNPEAG